MKRKNKLAIYVLLVLATYLSIPLIVVSPSSLARAFFGPRAKEKDILTFEIKSDYQRTTNLIRVLLPESMKEGEAYPVLYILPTAKKLFDPWWNNGIVQAAKHDVANKYDIICVAPTFSDMPWYVDHPTNPKIKQETYFLNDIIPYIDNNFPTIQSAQGRFLLGFSKSGTGAFSLMLRHPRLFAKSLSWDAPMLFEFDNVWGSKIHKIYGTRENFQDYQIPLLMKQKAPIFRNKDTKFVLMGYSGNRQAIEDVHMLLKSYKIPHVYDNTQQYRHNWHSGWFIKAVEHLLTRGGEG